MAPVDIAFGSSDTVLEDIRVLHTSGHTDGSCCFFYESPHGKSYLFSGDSFFQSNGEWATFVIESAGGTRKAMAESLEKLRELSPDVVMSSGFVGDVAFREVEQDAWAEALNDHIAKLRA